MHNKGDKVTGAIKSITDFGIFIGLEGGIDGLVHLSDISWQDSRAKMRFATTTRARKSKQWCWRLTRSASVFPWASSSSTRIPSPRSWPSHPRGSLVKGTVREV